MPQNPSIVNIKVDSLPVEFTDAFLGEWFKMHFNLIGELTVECLVCHLKMKYSEILQAGWDSERCRLDLLRHLSDKHNIT